MSHELLFGFTEVPALFERNDDDLYDRLSHRWTAALLLCFALFVTTSTYVGDPIHCWVPQHFQGSWTSYTDNYCWIRNTYYLEFDKHISKDERQAEKHSIVYYQWVPLILMFQALLFYLPIVFWRAKNDDTGMDMNDVIESAEKVQQVTTEEDRSRKLKNLAIQTDRYLGMRKLENKYGSFSVKALIKRVFGMCGRKYGNFITVLYFFVKIWFLANVLGQLWMMNYFLGQDYASYGTEAISRMISGEDWSRDHRFPRVTFCDVETRRLGALHEYTVQCVLTINLFNEKIYLFLWFWFIYIAAMTFLGLLMHAVRTFTPSYKDIYIGKHLTQGLADFDGNSPRNMEAMHMFIHDYLKSDGVLLTRLVGHNTNKATVRDYVCHCFKFFIQKPDVQKALADKVGDDDLIPLAASTSSDSHDSFA